VTDTAADRLNHIRARAQAATEGPWQRNTQYGPNFFANIDGPYLQGVGDLNFGIGEQAEADEALVTHAQQDITYLLVRVAELQSIATNARKLVSAWLQTAGEHHSISTLDTVKNDPLLAGMQEGRANQYSDCANELRDVLDGEDPDTWEHGVTVDISTGHDSDA
jgi:hypothetical protein